MDKQSKLIKSDLEGKINVLEGQLKHNKEELDRYRTLLLEQIRYQRNFGNEVVGKKLGLDDVND